MKTPARIFAIFALLVCASAFGQAYPTRPIKLVVPYPAGGGTDIAARWIAQKLGEQLQQPVIIDNRPGANGNIGTDAIAKAASDGYTIGMATPGPVTVGRSLYPKLAYDPEKDLAPIILANDSPIVLVLNPAVPANSMRELVKLARQKPGKLTAALVSTGSVPHLLTELLKSAAAIDILEVPYKGGSPAMPPELAETFEQETAVDGLLPESAAEHNEERHLQQRRAVPHHKMVRLIHGLSTQQRHHKRLHQ